MYLNYAKLMLINFNNNIKQLVNFNNAVVVKNNITNINNYHVPYLYHKARCLYCRSY